jgi:uncharacterized protein
MAKVVHFEIPVDDAARARDFYTSVFGWDFGEWEGGGYWLTDAGPEDEAGTGGALIERSELHASPVVVIGVASIDAALERAQAAGAEVVSPKSPIPSIGWAGYLRDPEGNIVGVFEPDPSAG